MSLPCEPCLMHLWKQVFSEHPSRTLGRWREKSGSHWLQVVCKNGPGRLRSSTRSVFLVFFPSTTSGWKYEIEGSFGGCWLPLLVFPLAGERMLGDVPQIVPVSRQSPLTYLLIARPPECAWSASTPELAHSREESRKHILAKVSWTFWGLGVSLPSCMFGGYQPSFRTQRPRSAIRREAHRTLYWRQECLCCYVHFAASWGDMWIIFALCYFTYFVLPKL